MMNSKSISVVATLLSIVFLTTGCGDASPITSSVKSSGPNGSNVCGCGGSCFSTSVDGIPDTWKTIGVDHNCDGIVDLDLSELGANTMHKDVFIQVDHLAPRPDQSTRFPFPQAAADEVVAAFLNAPVLNPDGTTGIHLHLIVGNELPYTKVVTLYRQQLDPNCSGADALALHDLQAQNMSAAKAAVFHYAIIADFSVCDTDQHCQNCTIGAPPAFQQTGYSAMNGRAFIVSLGAISGLFPSDPASSQLYQQMVAGTFMHELGHNFGLHHGGGNEDAPNYKPNYLSVMNYRYEFAVPLTGGRHKLDYSREALNDLDESHLNETTGLGSSDPELQFTFMDSGCTPRRANASGPVDWNGDGIANSTSVAADLNPQEDPSRNCGDVTTEVMHGHEDWSVIDYGFYNQTTPPNPNWN
jgi:hypothetical protein